VTHACAHHRLDQELPCWSRESFASGAGYLVMLRMTRCGRPDFCAIASSCVLRGDELAG